MVYLAISYPLLFIYACHQSQRKKRGWSLFHVNPSKRCCAKIWDLASGSHISVQPRSSSFSLCIICWLVPTLIKILHECISNSFTSLNIKVICEVTLSFTSYRLFQWYPQSNEISLNLGVKCWNSPFNPQGSRLIIVIVHIGLRAVQIYVAAVEALRKKERVDETHFTTKVSGKTSLGPGYFVL
jgi:hypothetical protein